MPQLDYEEFSRVSQIIDELADVVDDLGQASKNFVSDQIARKKKYGGAMFISPKQILWLKDLHEKYVGTTDHDDKQGP